MNQSINQPGGSTLERLDLGETGFEREQTWERLDLGETGFRRDWT
jgi:hypothetical protein